MHLRSIIEAFQKQENENFNLATESSSTTQQTRNLENRARETLDSIKDWSSRFGRDIHYGTEQATCHQTIRNNYIPGKTDLSRGRASIASIEWTKEHADIVSTISTSMSWHREAVQRIASEAEKLASKHVFSKSLEFEYIDVHRLQNIDEQQPYEQAGMIDSPPLSSNDLQPPDDSFESDNQVGQPSDNNSTLNNSDLSPPAHLGTGLEGDTTAGSEDLEPLPTPSKLQSTTTVRVPEENGTKFDEWQTPIRYLNLSRHKNFGDVLINTDESAVHVPVHIYPGEPSVMNAIAWSEELKDVFKENMVKNPKLSNQYFASQSGFLRLFPAQKWQIARTDPDLYDGRMRPWYAAAASSRKQVVILVDSSGSMTGSRRETAKGVVYEILDTLTDNDHFMVLKFSDTIQQVGVPNCAGMRVKKPGSAIPIKNQLRLKEEDSSDDLQAKFKFEYPSTASSDTPSEDQPKNVDIDGFYMLPATLKHVRHIKSNFTIPTSGIANFSRALVTAFKVLHNYQQSEQLGSACNQAIMLITDGSPSSFEDIFNQYNYPNLPVRVFTYLIGREAGDVTYTKMMACHNRGYYTHVINLAEVRETVQQYVPVMARPLVLNGTHPITWTSPYGDLTYQILTDWIWESKRRDKARAILASMGRGGGGSDQSGGMSTMRISTSSSGNDIDPGYSNPDDENFNPGFEQSIEDELEQIDHFGYQSNSDCFWQIHSNNLLTTVVMPVYDSHKESNITEKFLVKNTWTTRETLMRTAQILGVAAADMKINDIIALAPSHKLGPNGYAIMLTNNGYAMHHPDLRSVLEPFNISDLSERNMRILKPFFSSLDWTQVEHVLNQEDDKDFIQLRREAVAGNVGSRRLETKRTLDCQKRVQSRTQSFYHKTIAEFPFPFIISIPEPYGSHRIEAQVQIRVPNLQEKLTTYFTTSDFDFWTVHPKYSYCDGPSNNTVATLLDVFQRVEQGKGEDIQWRVTESSRPPLRIPNKLVCDRDLLQSLVYDAVATFGFSENCGPPNPNAEPNLISMLGVQFSFVATRNGLTRVRHFDANNDRIKLEALAFAKKHSRGVDETFYQRTVDYNLLISDSATLLQVPFNTFERIRIYLDDYQNELLVKAEMAATYDSSADPAPMPDDLTAMNQTPTRIQVKDMSIMEKLELLRNSSISMIATQSIMVNEGAQRAVAGVGGVFYNYASFVIRFFNLTSSRFGGESLDRKKPAICYSDSPNEDLCDESKMIKCGLSNDTIDCLLIDNNGYIVVSENLDFVGKHLKAYDPAILSRLLERRVFHEVNVTDYQAVCMRGEEKATVVGSLSSGATGSLASKLSNAPKVFTNLANALSYSWLFLTTLASQLSLASGALFAPGSSSSQQMSLAQLQQLSLSALLPNKTYLRPCERTITLYETRATDKAHRSDSVQYFTSKCNCRGWFVYDQIDKTNLIMLVVDNQGSDSYCNSYQSTYCLRSSSSDAIGDTIIESKNTEDKVCYNFERDSNLYKHKIDSCFSTHPDEEQIKICGVGSRSAHPMDIRILTLLVLLTTSWLLFDLYNN